MCFLRRSSLSVIFLPANFHEPWSRSWRTIVWRGRANLTQGDRQGFQGRPSRHAARIFTGPRIGASRSRSPQRQARTLRSPPSFIVPQRLQKPEGEYRPYNTDVCKMPSHTGIPHWHTIYIYISRRGKRCNTPTPISSLLSCFLVADFKKRYTGLSIIYMRCRFLTAKDYVLSMVTLRFRLHNAAEVKTYREIVISPVSAAILTKILRDAKKTYPFATDNGLHFMIQQMLHNR